ncbi:hypothetical protein U9M48_009821 [Paspalum notatum var. saurae]|uniref:Uncharacterized protein n=1 Tax=Paspalum notatum var. saurae TaxID=547442 RepID=A0AAQ3WFJ7_PASNO
MVDAPLTRLIAEQPGAERRHLQNLDTDRKERTMRALETSSDQEGGKKGDQVKMEAQFGVDFLGLQD